MRITVQLSAPPAVAVRDRSAREDAPALDALARQLGVELVPLHPGTADPRLATYLTADVADATRAEAIADRLRQADGVAAAYTTPPDEQP